MGSSRGAHNHRKVKKFLRSDPEFLQFLVGAEVLFRGWDYTRFALIHSWRGQLSDRVEQLPENPASVPSNRSRVLFYYSILVVLFGSIFIEIDITTLLIQLVVTVALVVVILWRGDFIRVLLFRHLVEFDVLKDYVAALNRHDDYAGQLPEARIVYKDKREKNQKQKQKTVVFGLGTLRELIPQLEGLLLRKRWGRFEFMFRQFEPLFTLYMKEVISGRGISDLVVAWSRAIVDNEHRAVSQHIISRVQEAYRDWSQISKTKCRVAELECPDKENITPTKFFETLSVKELTMDAGIAASRVLKMLAENSDIRTTSIIGSILDGIEGLNHYR